MAVTKFDKHRTDLWQDLKSILKLLTEGKRAMDTIVLLREHFPLPLQGRAAVQRGSSWERLSSHGPCRTDLRTGLHGVGKE
jgi:hypothetical protein